MSEISKRSGAIAPGLRKTSPSSREACLIPNSRSTYSPLWFSSPLLNTRISSPLRERPSWCASKLKSEAFAAPCQIDTRPNFPPHLPVHVEFLFVAVRRHAGGLGLSYAAARPVGVGHRRGRGFRHRDGERVRNRVGFEKSGGEVSCSRRRRIRSRTSTSSGRRPACHGRRRSRPGYGKGKEARQCFENFKGEPFFQSNPWPRSTPSLTR